MSWAKRLFMHQWSTPDRIDRVTGWLATFQNPLRRNGNVRLPFGSLAQEKSLPAVADNPLHYRAREITQTNPSSPTMRVAMFPSCIVDHFLPGAGYAAARVLQSMGAEVHIVEGRRCCGLPQLNSGDRPTAIAMAKAAIESLERIAADRIVIPSSSCAITIAKDESAVCCGFGGSFSFEYPEVANRVLERKLSNIEATGVDVVISDNPGCLTHLRGAMDAREKTTRVRHIAEVLWESLSSPG